jgi:hypothetical protein
MKNNKCLFLFTLLISVACHNKGPQTLISKWEKKTQDYNYVERKLASSVQGQCFKDIFTEETLKEEVREIEKKYSSGRKVTGYWKHLDLEKLPVPQANFLKTYGKEIGDLRSPEEIDYSSCEDVPCLFNKIYGKEDHVAGYVHYIWYLKFGHMLSADNKVPEQISPNPGEYNGKIIPLSAYLYDEKELYGLWRLSHMLKAPHATLKYLKEIQRIPRGESFEGAEFKEACGLAFSGGWIKLQDGCLTVDENPDFGYLYQAVTHELTHHVDFEQGRGSKSFYRSHKQDYLDISGMYLKEYVNKEGKIERQWDHKPDIKLMTPYAGVAPQENFAESISVFRVDGDLARKQVTSDHYDFLSRDYFESKYFEKENLMKTWIEEQSSETGKSVLKAVMDCSKGTVPGKSSIFKASDFSVSVLPGMLNCLGIKASEISNILRVRSSLSKPEGCVAISDNLLKDRWDVHMKDHLKSAFEIYLQELHKDKAYIARIQDYYNQIADKTIARNSFVNCFNEKNEEACYSDEILKNALDKTLSLNLPEEQTKEMAQMYVSYHPYNSIRTETLKDYQVFVSSHLEAIRSEAVTLWNQCLNLPQNDEMSPSGNLFQISAGYMISSLYNCLNIGIPDAIKEVIRNLSVDGMKVQHAKEELILSFEVQPLLVRILKDKYLSERENEIKAAAEFLLNDQGRVRTQLLSDLQWAKNIVDEKQLTSDCRRAGLRLISMKPLYHQRSELFSAYLETNSCFNISMAPEFQRLIEQSAEQFKEKVYRDIENKVIQLARAQAMDCLEIYPNDSIVNKIKYRKKREECLLNEWSGIEQDALQVASKDPVVIKFKMPLELFRMKLQSTRRPLQERITKEYFKLI